MTLTFASWNAAYTLASTPGLASRSTVSISIFSMVMAGEETARGGRSTAWSEIHAAGRERRLRYAEVVSDDRGWFGLREREISIGLFVACCATTAWAGGPWFAATLMGILLCHELGHYIV